MTKTKEASLKQKMAASVSSSAPSLIPIARKQEVPAAPEPKEAIPSVDGLIGDEEDRDTLKLLVQQKIDIDAQLEPLKRQKGSITDRIKTTLSNYGITSALCNGDKISYFSTEKYTINRMKLIGAGVEENIIDRCTDVTKGSQLRITLVKD